MADIHQLKSRKQLLSQLYEGGGVWDVVIIGGGATGLGTAIEATTKGYKTLLLEQADFAKGTSSRSTKLVHGGVRYLEQGNVKLVREAAVERGLLYKNAPHLVKNQQFIIPVYTWWDKWKFTIGLTLYDWLSGSLSMGNSKAISRKETMQRLPGVKCRGLVGGVVYHDGQFDDSRLAINLMQTVLANGGVAVNYTKVTGLLKQNGKVSGVAATDIETGQSFEVQAKSVVNATGVFVDDILHMDDPGKPKTICVSQGVHLVIGKEYYPSAEALMIPKTSDGRVLFAVPWHNKVILGTTDTPIGEASAEPRALEKEIDFIIETASGYLDKKPTRGNVLSVYAGLRPLAAPQGELQKTKEISRSHKIIVSPSGLFTILGGKWTTYRKMGEDLVHTIEENMGWPFKKSTTANATIFSAGNPADWSDPFYFYGKYTPEIHAMVKADADGWLSKELLIHQAQVLWAVKHEMCRTVEDMLSRRTRALLLNAKESIRMAPAVASIMAVELGKNEEWIQQQVGSYTALAQQYVIA